RTWRRTTPRRRSDPPRQEPERRRTGNRSCGAGRPTGVPAQAPLPRARLQPTGRLSICYHLAAMRNRLLALGGVGSIVLVFAGWHTAAQTAQPAAGARLYNTARQKILEGKTVVGGTVSSPDPNIYCAMASAGFDFTWIEMQHSPLTFSDVAKMIWSCRDA